VFDLQAKTEADGDHWIVVGHVRRLRRVRREA
jgi:hypothetical protein